MFQGCIFFRGPVLGMRPGAFGCEPSSACSSG